jgi:quinol monooxygenase YgiN
MHIYQLKIDIKPYKADEFLKSMQSFSSSIHEQKGCLSFTVYQDSGKQDTFSIVGEWKTRKAMEDHFRTNGFQVLVGAARVLGEAFSMMLAKVSNTGGLELSDELMEARSQKGKKTD